MADPCETDASRTSEQGPPPNRQLTARRKTAYYLGMGFMVAGLLLFASVFVYGILFVGPGFRDSQVKWIMLLACTAMGLLFAGGIVQQVGARGLAGSGVLLDPQRARRELEPFSRMAGGMVGDALNEVGERITGAAERVVMIKCSSCGKLNEEDSKFCQECARKL